MILAVPVFGHDPRFLKLLDHWFEMHAASGTKVPAIIITDEKVNGFPNLRVDTFDFRMAMRGHPWDRKGAIVAAAAQYLGRFLVCDLDAFIRKDPEPLMATLPDVTMATRADGWGRVIDIGGTRVAQRQAGVMWFGDAHNRQELGRLYRAGFHAAAEGFETDEWREQVAWSLAAVWTGLHDLPKGLNCSHHDPDAAGAYIVHEHGETKWKRIA
jgi:hypothetical protein